MYNFTYTYDPSHRLVSATDEINSTSRSYGDYDLNGFPLDVDGSSANYSYDSGRKRPKSISVSGGPGILFDSKGWAIEFAEGLDSIAFENSGSLQICD
ncbi:hypothetical protein LPTSP1_02410 [Leptospira johnsonii]|uniref:RHS repeat-associated core domain protein n=1 Tax=Leptospira johnsonii TaxID=1917820 RepID=A0A2P2CYE4_9LEPT|nr:hypothetical protein LPTSP1_02410 [Leptospira johnsonii]